MPDKTSNYMIKIATGFNLTETLLARSYLQAHNVPVFLTNEYILQANLSITVAVGGMELWVPSHFALKANTLLMQRDYISEERSNLKKLLFLTLLLLVSVPLFLEGLSLPAKGFFIVNKAIIRTLMPERSDGDFNPEMNGS